MIDQPQQQNYLPNNNLQIQPQNQTQHLASQFYSQLDSGEHLVNPPINVNFCISSLNEADLHTVNINTKLPVNANANSYDRVFRGEVNGQNQGAHQFWKKLRMIKKNYICSFCTSSSNTKNSLHSNPSISLITNNLHKIQCTQDKDWIISTLHNKIHLKSQEQDQNLLSRSSEKQWECLNNSINEEYYKQESIFGNAFKEKRYKNNRINMGHSRNRSGSTKAVMDLKYYNMNTALNQLHSLIHYYRFIMYIPLTPSKKGQKSGVKYIPQIFSIVSNYKNIKKALTYTTIKLQLIMQNNEKLQEQQKQRRQQSNKISSKNSSKNKISNKSSKIKTITKTNKKIKNDKNKKQTKNNYNIYIRQQTINTHYKNRQEQQYPSISRIPSDTNLVQSSLYYESIMDSLDNIRIQKLQNRQPMPLEQSLYARFEQPQSSQQSLLISNMSNSSSKSVKQLISCLDKSPKINHMTMITINSCQKPNITLHPTMQIIYQSQKTTPYLPHNISCNNTNEIQSISSNQILNSNARCRSPMRNMRNMRSNDTENGSICCGKSQSKIVDKSIKNKTKNKCTNKNNQLNSKQEIKIKDKYHEYFEKEQITKSNKNIKTTKQNKNKNSNKRASRGSLAKSLKNNKSHSQKNNQFNMLSHTMSKQQLNMNKNIGCQGKIQNRNQSKRKINKYKRIHKSCGSLEPHFKNYSHITSTKCADKGRYFQELEKSKEKAKYRDNAVFLTEARADSNDRSKKKLNSRGKNKKKKTKNKDQSQRSAQPQGSHPSNLKITQFKNIITKLKYKIKCSKVEFDSRTSENNRKSQTVVDIKQQKNDIMNIINTIKLKEQSIKRIKTIGVPQQDNVQKQTPPKQKYQEQTDRVLNRKVVENSGQITKKQQQKLEVDKDKDKDEQNIKNMKNKQKRYKNKQIKNKANKKCGKQKDIQIEKSEQRYKQKQKIDKKKQKKQMHLQSQSNKKTITQNDRKSSIKIQNKKRTSEKVTTCHKQVLKSKASIKKSRQEVYQSISQQF